MVLSAPFFSAYLASDLFGKLIFWSLLILSIASWVIMITKIKILKKIKINSKFFENIYKNRKENLLSFPLDGFSKKENPYFAIYSNTKEKTLDILNKNSYFSEKKDVYLSSADIDLLGSGIDSSISNQTKRLEKNIFVLSTVISLAPFLGLLGTVWGILVTFSSLQMQNFSANSAVLSGLSMALATTVFGLVVAIPALVAYSFIKNKIKEYVKDLEHFSNSLLTTLEIQYRKVEKR